MVTVDIMLRIYAVIIWYALIIGVILPMGQYCGSLRKQLYNLLTRALMPVIASDFQGASHPTQQWDGVVFTYPMATLIASSCTRSNLLRIYNFHFSVSQ